MTPLARILSLLLRPVFAMVFRFCFPLHITGLEHVIRRHEGPVILAGNHAGYLDGPMVMTAVDHQVRFLSDARVFHWRFVGWFVRALGAIPIHFGRPRSGLKQAVEALQQGQMLCLFPEGKLTRDGQIGPFLSGVGHVQKLSQAIVIPFAIHGGYEAWPYGQRKPRFRPVYIRFGEPIEASLPRQELVAQLRLSVHNLKEQLEQDALCFCPKPIPSTAPPEVA